MITTFFNGRLGNNIFQYIFCRIASIENKCNFFIPRGKEMSDRFYYEIGNKLNVRLDPSSKDNPHYWTGEELFDIDYGINDGNIDFILNEVNIDRVKDNCLLNGFFQSDKYLLKYEESIIHDWLKIKNSVKEKTENLMTKYPIDNYCFIHFRGGDYKTIPQFFLPIEYYKKCIDYIKDKIPEIKFVVVTDDVKESNIFFPDFDIISNTSDMDFYLLTQSKYSIIPNSSFSWWASWINMNRIITLAPNRWFNYNGYYGDGFEPPDIKSEKFIYL